MKTNRRDTNTAPFHRAAKNAPGDWLVYTALLRRGLRRNFGGLYVRVALGTLALRGQSPYPVIFCMTHSGWYDGHVAAVLNRRVFHHDVYLMMEEPNLARYFFFTWCGVFGIDRENPRNALASIEYIVGILREGGGRGKSLWMFPQGTMRHPDARPLGLYGGVANIARRVGRCAIVPVALRYDFLLEQAPVALARLGEPIMYEPKGDISPREITALLDAALSAEADRMHDDAAAYNLSGYKRLLGGRGSANRNWDSVLRVAGAPLRLLRRTRAKQ